jgi:hypothetical protein
MSSTIDETEPVEKQEEHATEAVKDVVPLTERVRHYVMETSGSLAEVSRVTGIPKTTLGGWLSGKKDLTTGVFDKVCEAYGIFPVRVAGKPSAMVVTAATLVRTHNPYQYFSAVEKHLLVLESEAIRKIQKEHNEERQILLETLKWYQSKLDAKTVLSTRALEELNGLMDRLDDLQHRNGEGQ